MHCYRRLPPIKAISFDLDDTLYDNWPVLVKAEQAQLDFIHQQVPQAKATDIKFWMDIRRQVIRQKPHLVHDISRWRQQGTQAALEQLGLDPASAQSLSQQAFAVFYQQRNQITIAPTVIAILEKLAARYPLIALTNGNANIDHTGLSALFRFVINAGDNGVKIKPAPDMFTIACERLKIPPQQLLHIGDSQKSDIKGALNAGCSAVWFNPGRCRLNNRSNLPHLEIGAINELEGLI